MPRIVALQPTETAMVDLGYFSWRLGIDATTLKTREGDVPCFSLVYRYVPAQLIAFRPQDGATLNLADYSMTALVRLEVDFQRELTAAHIKPVTQVALTRGNVTDDIVRMTEAYNMFRNGRPNVERLEACIASSAKIIEAYWGIRAWLGTGMKEERRLQVLETELVLLP